jgi:ATP-dependent DNA helicase RecQ
MLLEIRDILKKYWGFEQFRELQEDIILSVIAGNDTLALLPTGGGKSVCFQVPALAKEGMCLVISPLIALMKDQVEQLTRRQIKAAALFTGMHGREAEFILSNAVDGSYKFLYVSPERLKSSYFQDYLHNFKLNLIAVDEAHCISQWGYDFRPAYLDIADIRPLFPQTPVIALTASATPKVQKDIIQKLAFKGKHIFQKSYARPNLAYACLYSENKIAKIVELLKTVGGSGIVYTSTRKKCQQIAEQLYQQGIAADYYHAGLNVAQRNAKQQAWIDNKCRIMVCTNAFGMGIDKPDVRIVIHEEPPLGLEAYYQEAGRGGRDGLKSFAILLYNKADFLLLKEKVNASFPEVEYIKKTYAALGAYYQLAVGSSPLIAHDFDLLHFAKQFNFQPLKAHMALKKLEWAGLITLNDAYHRPSKVWFIVTNAELYQYQLENPRYDKFIKLLLRMYGGEIFTHFVAISETQLAINSQFKEEEVVKMLERFHKDEIILYEQQSDKAQVIFNTPRQDTHNMDFETGAYTMLQSNEMERLKNMIGYIENTQHCRQQILCEYFGDVHAADCAICDVCLGKLRKGELLNYDLYKNMALKLLNKPTKPEKLTEKLLPLTLKDVTNLLKRMIEEGLVSYNTETNYVTKI